MSLSLPMLSARRPEVAVLNLYRNGEQGAWYDPSDLSTLFQDAAGTTPVTAVGQPVGKLLDKSGRGNHASQATAAKRPTLQQDGGGNYYLAFDGVDDSLSTGSINFTSTDKMTVVAGVRKLSNAAATIVFELSANLNSNAGTFFLANHDAGGREWSSSARGTAAANSNQGAWDATPAPDTAVITGTHDISGDLSRLWRNGVLRNYGAGDKGAGNFGNYPLYIGARGGTSLPFNGRIYQLIVRGAASDAQQITDAETFTNSKTGAY